MTDGTRADVALERARTLLDLQRPADAEREARSALAEDAGNVRAHLYLARALSRQGDVDGALDAVNTYVAARPDDWVGHTEAGSILYSAGRWQEAVVAYQHALAHNTDEPFVYIRLAWTHYDLEEWYPARTAAEHALTLSPDDPEALAVLGMTLAEYGETQRAREHAERALELDPENAAMHRAHAVVLLKTGRPRDAADAFRESLRIDPAWTGGRQAVMQAEMSRNPLFGLHRRLWELRSKPRAQIVWWLGLCIVPFWFVFMAICTLLMWVNWVNLALTALWLHRDPRRRDLVEPAALYKIAGAALGAGAAMVLLGAVLHDGRTALLGLAVLSLVTPVMEPASLDGTRDALFMLLPLVLIGWLAVLIPVAYTLHPGWTMPAALGTFYVGMGSTWLSVLLHRRHTRARA
ncbi:tetratricopeptide repeat protein [Spirillospora sp. NPDC052242]